MNKLRFVVMILVLCAVAAAGPIPDSPTYINTARTIAVTGHANNLLNGGRFTGTIQAFGSVDFWCVDQRLTFSVGQSGLANVTRLSDVTTNAAQVRYGSIATEGGAGWSNDLGTVSFVEDAETRYTMAAWLIGQYKTSATSITTDGSANGDRNRAIQSAIWSILYNGAADPHAAYSEDGETASFWIGEAISNAASQVNKSQWAVVSWLVDSNGDLLAGRQTFMVQIVPEPGFYGVLALGLSGVFLALRRRKA